MPYPTPTSPTINDLQYQSFASIPGFGFSPSPYDQIITSEKVVLNLVGFTGLSFVEDFTTTSENVQLSLGNTGPQLFSLAVSDTTVTSENVVRA